MAAASEAQTRFQLNDRLLKATLQLQVHLQGIALLDTCVHHLLRARFVAGFGASMVLSWRQGGTEV